MVVLVTGAVSFQSLCQYPNKPTEPYHTYPQNRGIGLAICELILKSHSPVTLYAASRSGNDLNLKGSANSKVIYPRLDVTSSSSIDALHERIEKEVGSLDVLINNAGVNTMPEHNSESVRKTLDTNYRGTLNMCQTFLPLLSKSSSSSNKKPRIVNVSSVGSSLHIYNPDIRARFRDSEMSLTDLEVLAHEYERVVDAGEEKKRGWGQGQAYSVSKACVNALTAVLARENKGVVVNACCPGWVDTDMGGLVGRAPKTPGGFSLSFMNDFGEMGADFECS